MEEKIVSAAIKSKITNDIYTGRRHSDIIRNHYEEHGQFGPSNSEQGFITSTGRFVNRHEAAEIAFKCG